MFKKLSFFIILGIWVIHTNAQLVNVCGTDTVILEVDNYHVGLIEWQESIDSVMWVTIPEESGTSYSFFPEEAKYYRAAVKTSSCDVLYSAVSFVQIPPIANAGSDRIVGGNETNLLANEENGAHGEWTCISGSGVIAEPSNPRSVFTSELYDENILVWTLTNSCGQSSDTVIVKFEEIDAKSNYIIVDNTDELFSDSTDIAEGVIKVRFSDPSIHPSDSSILIGMRSDYSFLVKTISYTINDDRYIINTQKATIEDLFKKGTINVGDAINQSVDDNAETKSAIVFPTRETIRKNRENKGIKVLYIQTKEDHKLQHLKSAKDDGRSFTIPLPDAKLIETSDKELVLSVEDAYLSLTPNLVFDMDYTFPAKLKNVMFGLDNAVFEYNYKTSLKIKAPVYIVDPIKKKVVGITKYIVFMAGPVPVVVTANFDIEATLKASANAEVEVNNTVNHRKTFTAIVAGETVNSLNLVTSSVEQTTEDSNFLLQGSLTSEFKIGLDVSCRLYDVVGPFFKVPFKVESELCFNNQGNWDLDVKFGAEGSIGANAEILGNKFFDFRYDLFKRDFEHLEIPQKLELLSGNYQFANPNEQLPLPLVYKVVDSWGRNSPFVPIRFQLESGNGSVDEPLLTTNSNGLAKVYWTLGNQPLGILKASVLNCDNENIEGSPVYAYANTDEESNCANTNLSISLKTESGYILPEVSGGLQPYFYSEDGINFSEDQPVYDLSLPGEYYIYVKDANGCRVTRAITIDSSNPCQNSDLNLNAIVVQSSMLQLTASGGTPPYLFAIDDLSTFSDETHYNQLSSGTHQVYLEDSNGCKVQKSVVIEQSDEPAITALKPVKGSFVDVTNVAFEWVAAQYSISQYFDIYLKNEDQNYSKIASDIAGNTDIENNLYSYIHNQNLEYGKQYTCKIVLKDIFSVELASVEYSFYTLSGMSMEIPQPVLLAPVDNSNVELPVTLKWNNDSGNYKYDVYLGTDLSNLKMLAFHFGGNEIVLDDLQEYTKYYWKVTIKSLETGETKDSPVWSFNTQASSVQQTGTLIDIDGNNYNTVKIGKQWWMAENLKVTRNADGTAVPLVEDIETWKELADNESSFCYYGNLDENKDLYGALYSWAAATNGTEGLDDNSEIVQGVCPSGWHLPSDSEYSELADYLGGKSIAGGKMKTVGLDYWLQPNIQATNKSGFSALPGGYRVNSGQFARKTTHGYFWTSTPKLGKAYYHNLWSNSETLHRSMGDPNLGFSVRCVKDQEQTATLPTVITSDAVSYTSFSANCSGEVTSEGSAVVTSRGIEYSTNPNFVGGEGTQVEAEIAGSGIFYVTLSGLEAETTYYIMAYAQNSVGISYGDVLSFTTTKETATPSVTTLEAKNITTNSAIVNGNVISDGNANITERGFYWSSSDSSPDKNDHVVTISGTLGAYGETISNLEPDTRYYFCAFATNSEGTSTGDVLEFRTSQELSAPTVSTVAATNVAMESATLNGNVSSDGNANITERGFYWSSTDNTPDDGDYVVSVSGTTATFNETISGLNPDTRYYFCAFASNSEGTSTGDVLEFRTSQELSVPTVSTVAATNVAMGSATLNGNVSSDGNTNITERGFYWSSTNNTPDDGDNVVTISGTTGTFTETITGLNPDTRYYFCAFATNSEGTSTGDVLEFRTSQELSAPTVSTVSATNVAMESATLNGNVTSDGNADVTERGFYWSSTDNTPDDGDNVVMVSGTTGTFNETITGLNPDTRYYFCAFATNSEGTSTGTVMEFTTSKYSVNENYFMVDNTKYPLSHGANIYSGNFEGKGVYNRQVLLMSSSISINWTNLETSGTGDWISLDIYNTLAELEDGDYFFSSTVMNTETICDKDFNGDGIINSEDCFQTLPDGAKYMSLSYSSYYINMDVNTSDYGNQFSSGTITISKSGSEFTFLIDCIGKNDEVITGHFKGTLHYLNLTEAPTVTTTEATNITEGSAQSGGNVTSMNGEEVTARGVCWNTTGNPDIKDQKTEDGEGKGIFTSQISGLQANTTYYVRAYAINANGTAYGDQVEFTTNDIAPTVTNFSPTKSGVGEEETFSVSGSNLPETLSLWIDGVMTGNESPTTYSSSLVTFTVDLPNTYKLGGDKDYEVRPSPGSSEILKSGLITFGTIIPNITSFGPDTVVRGELATFEVEGEGLAEDLALWIDGIANNELSSYSPNKVTFDVQIPDDDEVVGNWEYQLRPYSIPSRIFQSGEIIVKNNLVVTLPTISTINISDITSNSASSGGSLTDDGGTSILERGVCWSENSAPTISDSKAVDAKTIVGGYSSQLTNLKAGTKYYVRAYATNSVGTAYGEEVSFTTENEAIVFGSFTDSRDGKTYKTVQIGEQTWMAENLAYLPSVSPSTSGSDSEFYYYVYGYEGNSVNDAKGTSNYNTYGVLYNWLAAIQACPDGWHLPSNEEWEQLAQFISDQNGGYSKIDENTWYSVGKHLKSTDGWNSGNGSGIDDFGFSAYPGGIRQSTGIFGSVGNYGTWWSATELSSNYPWRLYLGYDYDLLHRDHYSTKDWGFSVRCIKD